MAMSRVPCCCFGGGHVTFLSLEMEGGEGIYVVWKGSGGISYRLRFPSEKLFLHKLMERVQLLMNIITLRGRAHREVLGALNRAIKAA